MLHSVTIGEAVVTTPKASGNQTVRVQILASPEWAARVEAWRGAQRPIPSLSAAVRMLVDAALDGQGKGKS